MNLTAEEAKNYAQKFKDVFDMLPQDKGSKLMPYVTVEENLVGEGAVASDQIGKTEVEEETDRYADSPHNDVERDRRWYYPTSFKWGHLFAKLDKIRTLGDPQNAIAIAAKNAFGRKTDDKIIDAFFATAKTGKDGSIPTSFASGNIIAHGSAGLTADKLLKAKQIYRDNDVNIDDESPIVVISSLQETNLLSEAKYISRDYGAPVMDGKKLKSWLGFDFLVKNRLPKSDNIRSCPCFVKSAMGLGIWQDLEVNIDPARSDKSFLPYLFMRKIFGATRLNEAGCIEIQCSEA